MHLKEADHYRMLIFINSDTVGAELILSAVGLNVHLGDEVRITALEGGSTFSVINLHFRVRGISQVTMHFHKPNYDWETIKVNQYYEESI